MKITMGIKESKDKYGHVIDFIFCFRCVTFIDIHDYEIGDDDKCAECHRDDKIVPDSNSPNKTNDRFFLT
jgi:hypothetical protein